MSLDPRAIQIHTDGSCYMEQDRIWGVLRLLSTLTISRPARISNRRLWVRRKHQHQNGTNGMRQGTGMGIGKQPWQDVANLHRDDLQFLANNRNNIQYWKKNAWRYSSGEPVAHEDLWDAILKHMNKLSKVGLRVDFHYKKGKKDAMGKKVDQAAKAGLREAVSMLTLDSSQAATHVRWCPVVQPLSGFTPQARHWSYAHTRKIPAKNAKRK